MGTHRASSEAKAGTEWEEVSDTASFIVNKKATVSGGLLSLLPTSRLGYGFNRGWR